MKTLDEADFVRAAYSLRCGVANIKAVFEVEAPKGGFLPDGQVTILYERHQFSKRTNGIFDRSYPNISNPTPGGYLGGAAEHKRLQLAVNLNRQAALESTSWGKPQIMGFNHVAAGCSSLQEFVNAMSYSEGRQLDLFVSLIHNWGLDDELRDCRWADFSRRYNGANYKINRYDERLAAAFKKHGGV